MKDRLALLGLFVLSIILIVAGFEGSFGRLLACLLTPAAVVVTG